MKRHWIILLLAAFFFLAGCSGKTPYHQTPMPDPKMFNGHFGDIDTGGDDRVDWEEFKTHFPHATNAVFKMIDQNGDKRLEHDEWHQFKAAHGLKHQE